MDQKEQDEKLLNKIQTGDEAAFQLLFEKYYQQLCYSAYKICADEHKSKDLAQEVFLDIWKRRANLNIHTSFQAFLRRAVTYKAIDYVRAQKLDMKETIDLGSAPERSHQNLELNELKELIHRTAEKLPERCRIIFFMSRFEEMSHKEIAAKLEISEKTIENQITKALKILRKVIADYSSSIKLFLLFYLFS